MASVRPWRGKWQVRWRDPDGTPRSRLCSTKRTALKLQARAQAAEDLGERLDLDGDTSGPDLEARVKAYVADCDRAMKPSTVIRIGRTADLFLRFAKETGLTRVAEMS